MFLSCQKSIRIIVEYFDPSKKDQKYSPKNIASPLLVILISRFTVLGWKFCSKELFFGCIRVISLVDESNRLNCARDRNNVVFLILIQPLACANNFLIERVVVSHNYSHFMISEFDRDFLADESHQAFRSTDSLPG